MNSVIPGKIEIGDGVIYQKLHDEAVLLEMGSQRYFGLNDVAARMWELLLEDGTIESVVRRLASVYDVPEKVLREDIHSLVRDLMAVNLLKNPGQPGGCL